MRLCPQALEGARVLELTREGDRVRMSRQMGWDGVGEAGDEGDELMRGEACHWYVHRAGKRVLFCHHPLNQSPRVTHQPCSTNTRREEEKTARGSVEVPVWPRQETVTLIWTPIFKSP